MTLDSRTFREHEQTQELLPWYVNDTLEGRDAELVLKHLVACEDCQAERDRLYKLQQVIRESDSPIPEYQMSHRRIMQRVDAAERNKRSTRDVDQLGHRRRFFPMGIAASVMIALLSGAAWLVNQNGQQDEFQTLSRDMAYTGASQRMELSFVNPVPAATMRQALVDTNSNIVSGPDGNGNYLVEIVVPNDMNNLEYLSRIRKIEGITSARFVEN